MGRDEPPGGPLNQFFDLPADLLYALKRDELTYPLAIYVRDANGARTNITFQDLVDRTMNTKRTRADLHIHRGSDGELISSRQDGFVRMLA